MVDIYALYGNLNLDFNFRYYDVELKGRAD